MFFHSWVVLRGLNIPLDFAFPGSPSKQIWLKMFLMINEVCESMKCHR